MQRCVERMLIVVALAASTAALFAQAPAGRGQGARGAAAAPAPVTRPPLLYKEEWREPKYEGQRTDENQRFTPYCVANERLEAKLYGPDTRVVRTAQHEGRIDLWTGLSAGPVALTLRDKRNYVDLTGLARLRWMVRTNAIHTLYPVVKLAEGQLIVGDRLISTGGEFLAEEVAFGGMKWYTLDPAKVIVGTEVANPNLSKVDEVGLVTLAPAGGHGIAGSANLSWVELYAKAVPR